MATYGQWRAVQDYGAGIAGPTAVISGVVYTLQHWDGSVIAFTPPLGTGDGTWALRYDAAATYNPDPPPWQSRWGMIGFAHNGKFYFGCGSTSATPDPWAASQMNDLWVFDPADNSVANANSLSPGTLAYAQVANVGTDVYLYGGIDEGASLRNVLLKFNGTGWDTLAFPILGGTWNSIVAQPSFISDGASLYAVVGLEVCKYTVATDSWELLTTRPGLALYGSSDIANTVAWYQDGALYMGVGTDYSTSRVWGTIWKYHIATDTWGNDQALPTVLGGNAYGSFSCAHVSGYTYVFGGTAYGSMSSYPNYEFAPTGGAVPEPAVQLLGLLAFDGTDTPGTLTLTGSALDVITRAARLHLPLAIGFRLPDAGETGGYSRAIYASYTWWEANGVSSQSAFPYDYVNSGYGASYYKNASDAYAMLSPMSDNLWVGADPWAGTEVWRAFTFLDNTLPPDTIVASASIQVTPVALNSPFNYEGSVEIWWNGDDPRFGLSDQAAWESFGAAAPAAAWAPRVILW